MSVEEVQHYLNDPKKYPDDVSSKLNNFVVEAVTPKFRDGHYSSFKIGIPDSLATVVNRPAFWPKNSFVNKFYITRKQNFRNVSTIPVAR